MEVEATKVKRTGRIRMITLTSEEAFEELFLTELCRVFMPGHKGQVIVTHAKDNPNQIFTWDGEETCAG
jgi:hypothetical protein